jgi:hypothetical protein
MGRSCKAQVPSTSSRQAVRYNCISSKQGKCSKHSLRCLPVEKGKGLKSDVCLFRKEWNSSRRANTSANSAVIA